MILKLDGIRVDGGSMARYEILPGRHEVVVVGETNEGRGDWQSKATELCFSAVPKHMYKIRTSTSITELQDVEWHHVVLDVDSDRDVRFDCWEKPKLQQAVLSANGVAEPNSVSRAPRRYEPSMPDPTIVPPEHRPGTGLHVGLGGAYGGDKAATATYTNGDKSTIRAGSGFYVLLGSTLTPFWIDNSYGFGIGGSIGVKYDNIGASNGHVDLYRFPADLWLQTMMRVSPSWYLRLAAGPHKDLAVHMSASLDSYSAEGDLECPWGWMANFGVYWASSWYVAYEFGLQFTRIRYVHDRDSSDATNVGLGMSVHFNL